MQNQARYQQAKQTRNNATDLAASRPHPRHLHNGEEDRYRRGDDPGEPSYLANFTKGLPHHPETGLLLNPPDYQQFVLGIQSGDSVDFRLTPLGPALPPVTPGCLSRAKITCDSPPTTDCWQSYVAQDTQILKNPDYKPGCDQTPAQVRAWESQAAGLLYDLEGPDAQAVTMPPAPELDSNELTAEMAEIYLMALLRDTHFSQFRDASFGDQLEAGKGDCDCPPVIGVDQSIDMLKALKWFSDNCCDLNDQQRARHRTMAHLTRQTLFRGIAPGDDAGPYLSQFLLVGNSGINGCDEAHAISDGQIAYGAVRIDQKIRVAKPCKDYLTTFEAWVDVQNGADLRGLEQYLDSPAYRFITTPRDLATYVHYDALYEAYLNACILLLGMGAPFDPGIPFQAPDVRDKQQGFASFGGPHILTLVTEVATRALKAVRYQKFNVHRRLRPEALAGLIDRFKWVADPQVQAELRPVQGITGTLEAIGLLAKVVEHNHCQNQAYDRNHDASAIGDRYLLPMAFPEGSPMHPSYGAGHATVAGACVTILKAFFDTGWTLPFAYEANADGSALNALSLDRPLTLEGELNKLAANIAIGRDWAGVHYFTDYIESLRMGEQVALGILEEQKLCYHENFTMTVPLFDGSAIRI